MPRAAALAACLLVCTVHAGAASPVASNGSATVQPGAALEITLAATDGDGDTLDWIITSLPTKGVLAVGGNTIVSGDLPYTIPSNGNKTTYTADNDEHGTDTFQFKANDGGADSNTATVSIVVNLPPVQGNAITFTEPNTAVTFTPPAEDSDGDTLTFSITSLPGHGTLKSGSTTLIDAGIPYPVSSAGVTYTPDTDYHGPDSFTFIASDGMATSDTLIAHIEVNTTPVPDDLSVTVLPGGTVTIELTSIDADKDPVTYMIVSLPAHGALTVGGAALAGPDLPVTLAAGTTAVVYAVEAGYRGTDSFHYRVQDAVSVSDRAVVAIAVNTPPVAPDSAFTADKNAAVAGSLAPTDADGDTLIVRISTLPAAGALKVNGKAVKNTTTTYELADGAATFAYTPATDAVGTVSFNWVASDGKEDSIAAEVSMTFIDPNAEDPSPGPADPVEPVSGPGQDEELTDWTTDDEQVLPDSSPPQAVAAPCGMAMVETLVLSLALLLAGNRARRLPFAPKRR